MIGKTLFAAALSFLALAAQAQEPSAGGVAVSRAEAVNAPVQPVSASVAAAGVEQPVSLPAPEADTLALPPLTLRGTMASPTHFIPYVGWNEWSLHPGMNASISLAATVGLGRFRGSGFSQSVAMMYATELAPRLTVAVGGYYSHFNWGATQFNDAGLSAVVGYRFNEHWEAYVFGQKSVVSNKIPRPLYDLGDFGDRIGAELRYNVNPSLSIGMSFWVQDEPRR